MLDHPVKPMRAAGGAGQALGEKVFFDRIRKSVA